MECFKRYWAELDLGALHDNVNYLAEKSKKTLIGVVKADAYGHGDYAVAREMAACGVHYFAVSNLEEAMSLREKGMNDRILIFGTTPAANFDCLADEQLAQTVYSEDYAKQLSAFAVAQGKKITVHIKLDTGMGRMGFRCCGGADATETLCRVLALPGLAAEGIYTHFAVSDSTAKEDVAYTRQQYADFERQVQALQARGHHFELIHCQNSGAILTLQAPICNACRPGIVLYGISPMTGTELPKTPLRPVMSLHAVVTDVKTLPVGATVSYGRHFTATRPTRVAIIPAGYADGYVRALKTGFVLLGGKKAPIIGNICMDQFMVDVTELPAVSPGDSCVLLGQQGRERITADDLAALAGTIPYEITCWVSKRVPRVYVRDGVVRGEVCYL